MSGNLTPGDLVCSYHFGPTGPIILYKTCGCLDDNMSSQGKLHDEQLRIVVACHNRAVYVLTSLGMLGWTYADYFVKLKLAK